MKNAHAELKSVAKAITASMTRQGHPVPHSVVLNAMAAALNGRDWHTFKRVPTSSVTTPEQPNSLQFTGPAVTGLFWTEDKAHEVDFDARAYLHQATDAEIMAFIYEGFACCESTSRLALFAAVHDEGLQGAFSYLKTLQESGRTDVPGYDCSIRWAELAAWMNSERPSLLNHYLCADEGLQFTSSTNAHNPEVFWATPGYAATLRRGSTGFASKAAAEADAVAKMDLLAASLRVTR